MSSSPRLLTLNNSLPPLPAAGQVGMMKHERPRCVRTSVKDLLQFGDADVFLYHGLGLEPWVDGTLQHGLRGPATYSTTPCPVMRQPSISESILINKLPTSNRDLLPQMSLSAVTLGGLKTSRR